MGLQFSAKPVGMGCLMGLLMLAMLHQILTGDSDLGGVALIAFVAVHIAVVFALVLAGWVAARYAPRLKARLDRVHRPRLNHVAMMLAAALGTAFMLHLIIHGGV